MGVNQDDGDGSGDAWNRDSRPGSEGDFHGINYIGIAIVVIGIALYFIVTSFDSN
ncbi:MAG: hypothetical protein Q9M16_03110 [Mariprofundus sp.]|nr:hypothetical protein [Mariprofundus sp.]